jgi:cholesterol oxidase
MEPKERYEAVVIGTGFGGAITACRLSKKWPGEVLIVERGKRYPMYSFPRKPHDMARNFWNLPEETRVRPSRVAKKEMRGMFDIRNYKRMDSVFCAGYGGGSLIYANVFLEPPEQLFEQGWPRGIDKQTLRPYYDIAKSVLGARPIPTDGDPRREIKRTELFAEFAADQGRDSQLVDINVFFGNDFNKPTQIGVQEKNRYGALQTSCTYCAECDVGCNTHSKNTLDLNYLFVAEHRYQADVLTEHLGHKIVPLNEHGHEDPTADGAHGFKVYIRDLKSKAVRSVVARRVVVSAGAMGTTELLLRCRDLHKTLPGISDRLGMRFSANGDFLSFVIDGKKPADPNYGPVITQRTDYNLFSRFDRDRAFILEDASYPSFAAWFVEGIRPWYAHLWQALATLWDALKRFLGGRSNGRVGYAIGDILKGDISYASAVLLCMGLDRGDGVMTLDDKGYLRLDWPQKDSMPLYKAILSAGRKFKRFCHGKAFFALPNWWWPVRNNISVHNLGGCIMADDPGQGVVSGDPKTMGRVFGYQNLYCADGSVLPGAVGANPIATISAVSEMVAEGITGIKPDAEL